MTYADQINSQFYKQSSNYVSLAQRYDQSVTEEWQKQTIFHALANLRENNRELPNWHSWDDLPLCQSQSICLNDIVIDTTLQRKLDTTNLANILTRFNPFKVMPICVYRDESVTDKFVCWDGQHTAIALYVLANSILGSNIEFNEIKLPAVIYSSRQKAQMRECFIDLNGEGKMPLDHIDKIHQMIYGVRVDNSDNPYWQLVERKQTFFEKRKMFLTHSKFGNSWQPGAQSRLDEFINYKKYPEEITDQFAQYFFTICQSSRPVQPKETWMLYEFFNHCATSNVLVDDQYIFNVVQSLKTAFNDDFDSYALWERAKFSYQEWYRVNKPSPDTTLLGIQYPEKSIGTTFLIAQIRKNFSGPLPNIAPLWRVPEGDLF